MLGVRGSVTVSDPRRCGAGFRRSYRRGLGWLPGQGPPAPPKVIYFRAPHCLPLRLHACPLHPPRPHCTGRACHAGCPRAALNATSRGRRRGRPALTADHRLRGLGALVPSVTQCASSHAPPSTPDLQSACPMPPLSSHCF